MQGLGCSDVGLRVLGCRVWAPFCLISSPTQAFQEAYLNMILAWKGLSCNLSLQDAAAA